MEIYTAEHWEQKLAEITAMLCRHQSERQAAVGKVESLEAMVASAPAAERKVLALLLSQGKLLLSLHDDAVRLVEQIQRAAMEGLEAAVALKSQPSGG